MSKRVEAQDGNISINPITGVVEVYNVNSLVTQTTTAALGGLLVDQGLGLSPVITESTLPIADGTVDGDMLYWDQTGTQTFLASSNISWSETNQALSIGTNLTIEDQGGTPGTSGITQLKNGGGTVMLQFIDTDGPWVQIEDFNLKLADDGASVSRRAAFWGGSRNEIQTLADGEFNFSAENPNGTPRAHFDYPVSILNTGAPPATRSNSAQLWVNSAGSSFNPVLLVKNQTTSWPVGQATSLHYYYNNPTAAADPGTQRLRFNTADFATAGEIYLSDFDFSEEDSGWWFGRAAVGDVITMSSGADRTEWCEAQIDSITDNTGWWTIEVTILDHAGTMFTNGQDCRVDLVRSSILTTGGNIGGSITDNQIAVGAATANNIEGSASLTWDAAQFILGVTPGSFAATPTLAFGDGDTGFYEVLDDSLTVSVAGAATAQFLASSIRSAAGADGWSLNCTVLQSYTVPAYGFRGDGNTGINQGADDEISVITGGVEANRFIARTVPTTDATVTEIASVAVPSDEGFGFEIHVMGTDDTNDDVVFERIFGAIYNATGTTALVGSTITDRTDTAGASGWVITVAADDGADTLTVDVTGAAVNIDWKCRINILNV